MSWRADLEVRGTQAAASSSVAGRRRPERAAAGCCCGSAARWHSTPSGPTSCLRSPNGAVTKQCHSRNAYLDPACVPRHGLWFHSTDPSAPRLGRYGATTASIVVSFRRVVSFVLSFAIFPKPWSAAALHATLPASYSRKSKIRIPIQTYQMSFDSSGFRCGAKCCMGAPRGSDFLFAPLGAVNASTPRTTTHCRTALTALSGRQHPGPCRRRHSRHPRRLLAAGAAVPHTLYFCYSCMVVGMSVPMIAVLCGVVALCVCVCCVLTCPTIVFVQRATATGGRRPAVDGALAASKGHGGLRKGHSAIDLQMLHQQVGPATSWEEGC